MRAALVLAACGGGTAAVDAPIVHDAPADASACLVPSVFASTAAVGGTEKTSADANPPVDGLFYEGYANADAKPDGFYLFLFSGGGPFANGLAPMTIDFAAMPAEQNGDTCSACLVLEGDVDRATNQETVDYLPRSGTLTITSLTDRFSATLTDATFRQVDMPAGGTTPDDPSGCTTRVASYAFSAPITVETDGGTFAGKRRR